MQAIISCDWYELQSAPTLWSGPALPVCLFQDALSLVEGLELLPSNWTTWPNKLEPTRVKRVSAGIKSFKGKRCIPPHRFLEFKREAELLPSMNKLNSDPQQELSLSNVFVFCRIFTERESPFRQEYKCRNSKDKPHVLLTLTCTSSLTGATWGHTIKPIT